MVGEFAGNGGVFSGGFGKRGMLTSSANVRDWLMAHRASVNSWGILATIVIVVFLFFSDRDFSFLLTLSSLTSMFCFFMIAQKIERQKSANGVSIKMMECYLVLLACRLCSIIPFEGYLPYDRTGDWLYQLTEALALCLCGTIIFLGKHQYKNTYDENVDSFKHLFLFVPALLLAVVFHPTLNAFMPADIAWTFSLYLEAVASLPQLFCFQKQKSVAPFTSHFLAGQVLSKLFSFIFWAATFKELNDASKPLKSVAGIWVVICQIIQLIVMGDFIYIYIKWYANCDKLMNYTHTHIHSHISNNRCLISGINLQFDIWKTCAIFHA